MSDTPQIDKRALLEFAKNVPFLKFIGIEVVDVAPLWSKTTIAFREELCQPAGILHGGVMASLVDTGIAHALMLSESVQENFGQGGALVSVDLRIKYLRPVSSGTLTCESRITRMGRQIIHGESVVVNDDGKEAARGDSIYMAIGGERLRG